MWDGLWLHCIVQATGQMQCKRHTSSVTLTVDIQAGRALTLISIIAGLLGFIVTLLGGGVVNCSGDPPDPVEPQSTSSSKKKVLVVLFFFFYIKWRYITTENQIFIIYLIFGLCNEVTSALCVCYMPLSYILKKLLCNKPGISRWRLMATKT